MEHTSDEQEDILDVLGAMFNAAVGEIRSGNKMFSVYESAKRVVQETKYEQFHISHGIGLEVRETPEMSPKTDQVFQEDMVMMCEVGLTIPNKVGVRIEDMVLVTDHGPEILSKTNRESRIL